MTNKYIIPSVNELMEKTEYGNHLFSLVSLFAGGGGSSTGYRMAGGKVLLVNEFIDEAVNTYKSNWPKTKIIKGDIREIGSDSILSAINKNKYELDLLDGSPPCSAFSTLGAISKNWGKNKKYSDSNQSSVENLFFEYIRILEGIMPRVFVAENVMGLSVGKSKGFLNEIIRGLKNAGYYVEAKLLNAKYLGVPQSRTRLIFVGIRNDLMRQEYINKLHPKPINNMVCLKDAFYGLEFTDQDRKETDIKKFSNYKKLITLSPGENHKKNFSLSKASPYGISECITATTGNIASFSPMHWNNRAFTVSEIKRIMSIPDDYILTGTYQQKVERLGRIVAPFMMKEIANNLINIGVLYGNTRKLDI